MSAGTRRRLQGTADADAVLRSHPIEQVDDKCDQLAVVAGPGHRVDPCLGRGRLPRGELEGTIARVQFEVLAQEGGGGRAEFFLQTAVIDPGDHDARAGEMARHPAFDPRDQEQETNRQGIDQAHAKGESGCEEQEVLGQVRRGAGSVLQTFQKILLRVRFRALFKPLRGAFPLWLLLQRFDVDPVRLFLAAVAPERFRRGAGAFTADLGQAFAGALNRCFVLQLGFVGRFRCCHPTQGQQGIAAATVHHAHLNCPADGRFLLRHRLRRDEDERGECQRECRPAKPAQVGRAHRGTLAQVFSERKTKFD